MTLRAFGISDVGRRREHNEDFFIVDEEAGIFIVCDGMGGHAAGEVASKLAAETVHRVLRRDVGLMRDVRDHDTPDRRERVRALVESAGHAACLEVFQAGQSDSDKAGMGTTLVMLVVAGNAAVVGHVGDSRLYLHRKGAIHQLTEDHTCVNELVRSQKMTREQALATPYAHVLTRAIGSHATVGVDTMVLDIAPGDTFLLCSDGLSGYFEDNRELAPFIDEHPIEDIGNRLIEHCNERGGRDNITVLLVRNEGDPANRRQNTVRAADIERRLEVLHQVHLFKHLTYKELVEVMSCSRPLQADAGQTLIQEGAEEDEVYVVVEGEVEVSRQGHVITTLGTGAHFGEMEMVARRSRSATVKALVPTRLLAISRTDFFALIRKDQSVAVKLLWGFVQTLSSRLHHANQLLPPGETPDETVPF